MEAHEVIEYRTHLEGVWSRAHNHWRSVIDPWYWGTARIWDAGSKRSTYMPSTARAIIEHASDVQLPWEPKFHRTPVGRRDGNGKFSREAQAAADRVEAGARAVFFDAMLRNPDLAFKAAGKYIVQYGYAIIFGPVMEFEDQPEEPKRDDFDDAEEYEWAVIDFKNGKRSWNPIRITAPHPDTVLLDPSERQPKTGIPHNYQYRSHIKALLDGLRDRDRKPEHVASDRDLDQFMQGDPFTLMEVTEYWDAKTHMMVYNSMPLFVERNLLGFVPFNHAFSGFGTRPSGDSQNDPFYLAQGLLDAVLPGLKVQAQAASAKHNAIVERSYLRLMAKDPANAAEQLAQEDAVIEVTGEDPDKEIAFLAYPDMGRFFFSASAEVDNDIQLGTYVSDVAGVRQEGVSTVGQQVQLSTSANRKFNNPAKQLNMMATVVGQNKLRLVDRYGDPIHIGGAVLDPADIAHDYNLVAEFEAVDPNFNLQQREVGMREVAAGLKSKQTYQESDLRVANYSEEFMRIMAEQVRQSPEYLSAIAREVAKADGMLDAVEGIRNAEDEIPPQAAAGGQPQISDLAGGGALRSMEGAASGMNGRR